MRRLRSINIVGLSLSLRVIVDYGIVALSTCPNIQAACPHAAPLLASCDLPVASADTYFIVSYRQEVSVTAKVYSISGSTLFLSFPLLTFPSRTWLENSGFLLLGQCKYQYK